MMDPNTWKKQCVNTKGFGPEHVPLLVRAVTRLITDSKVPIPAAIYVATNWAGIFKVNTTASSWTVFELNTFSSLLCPV